MRTAGPIVIILESRNVVLAKISSALDLDKNQHAGPGIGDPVFGLCRYVGFLICSQADFLFVQSNDRFAGYDDPVFAAALMQLQAEAMTRLHFNPFDLVAFGFGEHFVRAPWAFISLDVHIIDDCTTAGGMTSLRLRLPVRTKRKRGWLPIPAFSHREPPFCVAAINYLFFAPFLAAFFGAAFFLAPPFFAVAILCFSFR